MMKKFTIYLPLLMCFSLLACSSAQADGQLFRYKNDRGNRVISDSISPYDAAKGYEIIDSRGTVIKTVPKELSAAQKAQQQLQLQEQAKLDKWDKELRSRYHNLKDIQATKQRRLEGVDNSIASLQLTLENISDTIKHYQAEAAANERQGEVVAADTLASMARLQKDRDFIEQETYKRQAKRTEIIDEFDKDIQRFKVITSQ